MKLVHGTESLSLFGFRASFPTMACTAHPPHTCLTFGFSLQTQVCLFEGVLFSGDGVCGTVELCAHSCCASK